MTYQNKNLLKVFALLLLMTAALYWVFAGNRGHVIIETIKSPYTLVIKDFRKFDCFDDACQFDIPFGKQQVCVQKAGFFESCQTITVPWRKQISFEPTLQRVPRLHVDKTPISIENDTAAINRDPLRTLTESGTQYFWQNSAGALMRGSPDMPESAELVTTFSQLPVTQIMAFGNDILVITAKEVFLVDPTAASRQRIFVGIDIAAKPLDDKIIALADANNLYLYNAVTKQQTKLPFFTPPAWLTTCDGNALVGAITETETNIRFFGFETATATENIITTAKLTDQIVSLTCANEPNAVALELESGKRVLLRY